MKGSNTDIAKVLLEEEFGNVFARGDIGLYEKAKNQYLRWQGGMSHQGFMNLLNARHLILDPVA